MSAAAVVVIEFLVAAPALPDVLASSDDVMAVIAGVKVVVSTTINPLAVKGSDVCCGCSSTKQLGHS